MSETVSNQLDPIFVSARARRQLRAPPGFELLLEGEQMIATGSAPPDWIERYREELSPPPGAAELDLKGVGAKPTAPEKPAGLP